MLRRKSCGPATPLVCNVPRRRLRIVMGLSEVSWRTVLCWVLCAADLSYVQIFPYENN